MVLLWLKPASYCPMAQTLMAISTPGTTNSGKSTTSKRAHAKRAPTPAVAAEIPANAPPEPMSKAYCNGKLIRTLKASKPQNKYESRSGSLAAPKPSAVYGP